MLCTNNDIDSLISRLAEDTTETSYLILGGFQSIRLPAALPIRPISLLYGPNSSGKSAISDALRYLEWDLDAKDRKSSFDRWLNNQSKEILIGFSWLGNLKSLVLAGESQFIGYYGDLLQEVSCGLDELPFEEMPLMRLTWLIRDGRDIERSVELYACGVKVATLELDSLAEFNVYRSGIERLGDSEPNIRWLLKLLSRVRYLNGKNENEFQIFFSERECMGVIWPNLSKSQDVIDKPILQMTYHTLIDSSWLENVSDLMRVFFSRPILGISHLPDAFILGPIRPVLGEAELRFLCQDNKAAISLDTRSAEANGVWRILADDIASPFFEKPDTTASYRKEGLEEINRWRNEHSLPPVGMDFATAPKPKGLLADVNRWLNDESFFGTDCCLLADPSEIVSLANDDVVIKRILVEFWLRNGAGKKLSFNDVGTGFSQVLPIIIYALNGDRTLFVEQPELHLHPRVQHRLADLFIESIRRKRSKFCIIETHSEHIALRVLRRIRETGRSNIPHSRWFIKPEEVSVLYFEPEGGQTYIHELRIDSAGEFIDKWPRGFFEERYEDLFDEPRMGD